VVEDDNDIQNLLEEALIDAGFAVTQAMSGEAAIELLDSKDLHFRALVTDVDLKSGITGWDVARHAREISPDLPVIYAASTLHEWGSMGVPNSIQIAKPYAPSQIVTAVSQLLNATPASET
jgi:DNA-binding response OmpR family regulator